MVAAHKEAMQALRDQGQLEAQEQIAGYKKQLKEVLQEKTKVRQKELHWTRPMTSEVTKFCNYNILGQKLEVKEQLRR